MPRPPAKAQSLADALAAKIAGGSDAAGSWLPSERDLAREYEVDRSTVRRALRILGERGIIKVTSGTGAQVGHHDEALRRAADDVTQQVGTWRGFHVSATKSGREAYTETTVNDVPLISPLPKVWACRPERSSYSVRDDKELPASAACSSPRATSGET